MNNVLRSGPPKQKLAGVNMNLDERMIGNAEKVIQASSAERKAIWREHILQLRVFQETQDQENFQGRYVMRHPWRGTASCPAAEDYRAALPARFKREAENLASLTGWDMRDIATQMEANGQSTQTK